MAQPRHTVVETAAYLAAAKREGLGEADREGVVTQIAADPQGGDMVRESGGVRKVRYLGSGGFRVMAAYLGEDIPIYLLAILKKGTRANFTKAEVHAMRDATKAIRQAWKDRRTLVARRRDG